MVRIYFDKQVFSDLFKQEKEEYIKLLDNIKSQKSSLFCYSHAHLLDLKNDKTDIKYEELKFIETIVVDNYLSYHALDKYTTCYLVKPIEAFKDIEEEPGLGDVDTLFDLFLDDLPQESIKAIEQVEDLLKNLEFDFHPSMTELPEGANKETIEAYKTIEKLFPKDADSYSLMDFMKHFAGMLSKMHKDKSIYRNFRNASYKSFNDGKFVVDYDEIDFNEDLKNSQLQKTFIEFVNNSINPNEDKEVSKYDFYVNAYLNLDLLGISKEKSVVINNMLNDSLHSYYGAYCDCVVSRDSGFIKKTRVLYKLLKIDAKVIHIDDFIKTFNFVVQKEEKSVDAFSDLLINDIENALIIDSYKSLDKSRETTTLKPVHNYLGFFNRIDKIRENGKDFLYFYRRTDNYSNFTFIREYELVVNNAVNIFGTDQFFRKEFDWEKDKKSMTLGKWEGREWDFNNFTLRIETNPGTNELSMLMSFRKTFNR